MSPLQFCLPVFLGIHRSSKQVWSTFLRWYWSFNRDFWENFKPRCLIEQYSKLQNQQKIDTCPYTSNLLDYSQCKYVSKGQKGHLFSITLRGEKQHVVYKSKYSHSKQLRVPLVKTVYGKKLPERRPKWFTTCFCYFMLWNKCLSTLTYVC